MNFKTLAFHAERLLARVQPEALRRPEPVDVRAILRDAEYLFGVMLAPGSADELGNAEGYYDHSAGLIVLRRDVFDALESRCDMTHRARATAAHELSHVNLRDLSSDEDDAWAHAGCLMMPCAIVRSLTVIDDVTVSEVFDVSAQFAHRHLWRMKRANLL